MRSESLHESFFHFLRMRTRNEQNEWASENPKFFSSAGFPLANFFARSDLFPLSASILPRLADVISDTDKGKRSLRARKFASGKPA